MPEKIRSFIAIPLPKNIETYLSSLILELKKTNADVKWVKPENIHLTLKFLGGQDAEILEKIRIILDKLVADKNVYPLGISHIGGFPKIENPRVIWVGLSSGDKETKAIAKELDEKINKLGIPKEERAFSSHITIGRVRSPLNKDKLTAALKNCAIEEEKLSFDADKIILYKSTLLPGGPVYEVIYEASLKKT
ncbi:MAG: RNA 2',3'-cyclic phosphodiesterase [Candidatus Omnitrophica bacterium]|nr:RNA 2',3'-cyclic phosphodiesterase [Candidatus Omnitrophota bacterium]MDD5611084.1 RNA 2',3'-cyclic phosphodiesterase [Candidatus Omnitrophota bacterium]